MSRPSSIVLRPCFAAFTLLLLLGALGLPAGLAPAAAAPAPPALDRAREAIDQELSAPEAHCSPSLERQIPSRVVSEGGTLKVELRYQYRCPEGKRRVHFMLVVESSSSLGRRRAEQVRDGLTAFVEQMDFDGGSRGGLIVYGASASLRTALRGGAGGKQALISAVRGINASGNSAAAADDAIALAIETLAAEPAGEDTDPVILLLDAGEALEAYGQPVLDACEAAKDAGIRMAVVGLEPTEGRLQACADPYLYRGSGRMTGEDLPPQLEALGDGLARAHHIDLAQFTHLLSQHFDYVPGSASPREPDSVFAGEIFWQLEEPPPDEGYALSYRLRPIPDLIEERVPLGLESSLDLGYADSSLLRMMLEPVDVCVHPYNRPEFCADFVLTLTPPAPTDTPAPTPTHTPTPPEPTPTEAAPDTATPTPTEPPPDGSIYLPLNLARARLEG